jgi:hypothetical protein
MFHLQFGYLPGGLNTIVNEMEVEGFFEIVDLLKSLYFLFEFM